MIVFGLMSARLPVDAVVLTREQYRELITQGRFSVRYGTIGYDEKARIFENIRNAYAISREAAMREAFAEMANGNVYLRLELNHICEISRNYFELLSNLNNISEAYYSLTNDERPEPEVVARFREYLENHN